MPAPPGGGGGGGSTPTLPVAGVKEKAAAAQLHESHEVYVCAPKPVAPSGTPMAAPHTASADVRFCSCPFVE